MNLILQTMKVETKVEEFYGQFYFFSVLVAKRKEIIGNKRTIST